MKENTIDLEIETIKDILNPFNQNQISNEFGNYIYKECKGIPLKKKITLNIKTNIEENDKRKITAMIHAYFGKDVQENSIILKYDMIRQLLLIFLGIIFICVSYIIKQNTEFLFSELFLIAGWVVVWEAIYGFLFTETKYHFRIKRLKQLSSCKICFISNKSHL